MPLRLTTTNATTYRHIVLFLVIAAGVAALPNFAVPVWAGSPAAEATAKEIKRSILAAENGIEFDRDTAFYLLQAMVKDPYPLEWLLSRSPQINQERDEFKRVEARIDVAGAINLRTELQKDSPNIVLFVDTSLGDYDFSRGGFPTSLISEYRSELVEIADFPRLSEKREVLRLNLSGLERLALLPMPEIEARKLVQRFTDEPGRAASERRVGVILVATKTSAQRRNYQDKFYDSLGVINLHVVKAIFHIYDHPEQRLRVMPSSGSHS